MELLGWVKSSEVDMLLRICAFHYELELIHPFADWNSCVNRLWHTIALQIEPSLFLAPGGVHQPCPSAGVL